MGCAAQGNQGLWALLTFLRIMAANSSHEPMDGTNKDQQSSAQFTKGCRLRGGIGLAMLLI